MSALKLRARIGVVAVCATALPAIMFPASPARPVATGLRVRMRGSEHSRMADSTLLEDDEAKQQRLRDEVEMRQLKISNPAEFHRRQRKKAHEIMNSCGGGTVLEERMRVVWKANGEPIGELLNKEVTDRGKPGWRVRKPDGVDVVAEELMELEGRKLSDADLRKLEGVEFTEKGVMACQLEGSSQWERTRTALEIGIPVVELALQSRHNWGNLEHWWFVARAPAQGYYLVFEYGRRGTRIRLHENMEDVLEQGIGRSGVLNKFVIGPRQCQVPYSVYDGLACYAALLEKWNDYEYDLHTHNCQQFARTLMNGKWRADSNSHMQPRAIFGLERGETREYLEAPLKEGDKVLARHVNPCHVDTANWYPAEIHAVNRDGTYDVHYDDGHKDPRVTAQCIKKNFYWNASCEEDVEANEPLLGDANSENIFNRRGGSIAIWAGDYSAEGRSEGGGGSGGFLPTTVFLAATSDSNWAQLRTMLKTTSNNVDPEKWWNPTELIGQEVRCTGGSGFGSYKGYITDVNMTEGWFLIEGGEYSKPTWKTARLCSFPAAATDATSGICSDSNWAQFRTMLKTTSNNDPEELIGREVRCTGASGFGSYKGYITGVNTAKGWFLIEGGEYSKPTWKTARLCSLP